MGFELGALLGAFDGSQSFETLNSWDVTSLNPAWTAINTDSLTHSSGLGMVIVNSNGATSYVKYNYTTSDDVMNRWMTDVNTHRIVSYFWESHSSANLSYPSGVRVTVGSELLSFGNSSSITMQRHRIETFINSSSTFQFEIAITPLSVDRCEIYFDDILTTIDPITLHPEWDLKLKDELFMVDHQTIGGANPSYVWGFNKKWEVLLEHIEENEARLLNQWWQDMRPLLFTSDTSDYTQQFIVTMTNKETPMNNLSRIYHDEWKGTLELSAYNTSLVF